MALLRQAELVGRSERREHWMRFEPGMTTHPGEIVAIAQHVLGVVQVARPLFLGVRAHSDE